MPGKILTRVISWGAIGVAFTLSLALILNNFIGLKSVLNDYALEQEDGLMAAALSSLKKADGEVNSRKPIETDRIIVKFKDTDLPPGFAVAAEKANLEQAEGLKKVLSIEAIGAEVYEVPSDSTADESLQRIKNKYKDALEYAEVDMLLAPALIPNDQYFPNQWHHTNVKTPTAWDTTLGVGVSIAILDTGVDPNHSDLEFSDQPGWNFYDNNSNWADVATHGTRVAGAAAAVGNNTIGVSGIAPQARILPVRVAGPDTYAYMSAIAKGITYAADHGARVANASYSNVCGSATIWSAAKYLRSKGGVFIASAGNTGADNAYAATSDLTCVSATGSNDLRTSWSSFGVSTDVAAPGAGIYSTTPGGGYTSVSGTSFSAPITAGLYALLFSVNPQLTPAQADNIIFSTAKDVGDPGWDKYYGFGVIDVTKAVALAVTTVGIQGTLDTIPPSVPTNLSVGTVTHNSVALTWGPSTDDRAVAQYSVYRNGVKIATVGGTSYTNTSLAADTTYSYTVRAEDSANNQSADSNTVSAKTATAPFAIGTYSVQSKTSTTSAVVVNLTKNGTVTVKYGTSASNLATTVQSTTSAMSHTLMMGGLSAGTTYYYQITANDGVTTVTSAISSFKTPRATGGGKRK